MMLTPGPLKDIFKIFYSNFFSFLLQSLYTFYLIFILEPSQLGRFSFIIILLGTINNFLSFGFRQFTIQKLRTSKSYFSIIINNTFIHLSFIIIVSFTFFIIINNYIHDISETTYLLGIFFILISITSSQLSGIYLGLSKYDIYLKQNIYFHLFRFFLLIIINQLLAIKINIIILIIILSYFFSMILTYLKLDIAHSGEWVFNLKFYKDMIKNGFFYGINLLLVGLIYSVDVLILKIHVQDSELGFYHIASSIINVVCLIPQSIGLYFFTENTKNDISEKNLFKTNLIKFSIKVCMSIAVLTMFLSNILMNVSYLENYFKSFIIIIILSPGLLGLFLIKIIYPILVRKIKPIKFLSILLFGTSLNVLLNIFLIPSMSIYGAALSSSFTYSCIGLWLYSKYNQYLMMASKDL